MKRSCTPTWIDAAGETRSLQRVRLNERVFSEEFLQEELHRCPTLLPIDDFDEEFGPLVSLGREVECIDNLFVSPSGRLTLVETKLWRNPEAVRTVVAQILDYAVRVSRWSYEDLERNARVALHSALSDGTTLHELMKRRFPDRTPDESSFHDAVQKSLHTGRFLLLVVGDGIREGLESLLESLHSHPRLFFTFGLVELQVFSDPTSPGSKLIVPQLLANSVEVVRAVVRVEGHANVIVEIDDSPSAQGESRSRRMLSEEEFFGKIQDRSHADVVRRILTRARALGAVVEPRSASVSVRLPDPAGTKQKLTLFVVNTDPAIYTDWLSDQLDQIGSDRAIASDWMSRLTRMFPGVQRHAKRPDALTRAITIEELDCAFDEFVANLRSVIEAINESVRENVGDASPDSLPTSL